MPTVKKDSHKEPPISLNAILVLGLAARGQFHPSYLPDEEDNRCWFERNRKYQSFHEAVFWLKENGYLTPDITAITEKGTLFLQLFLDRATHIHRDVLTETLNAKLINGADGLAEGFTRSSRNSSMVPNPPGPDEED